MPLRVVARVRLCVVYEVHHVVHGRCDDYLPACSHNHGVYELLTRRGSLTWLLYFNAEPGEGVITLQWATATERDNYGFNLYRATSEDGERTLLNAELIPSLVAPGSPFGAEYEFVDSTAEAGVQYYYWLEDVDIYMLSTLHGPAAAILE